MALLSTLRGWGSFERVGEPAKQGGQSLNRLDWAVTSIPSSSVPLLAHRAEAEASQNKRFYYTVGGLGPVGNRGAGRVWCWGALGGTVKMEEIWLRVPGQVGAHSREKGKRQHRLHSHFSILSSTPTALNKQKATLYSTKYIGRSFPQLWTVQSGKSSSGGQGWASSF